MGNEARVLGCPSGMRCPFVIQDLFAHLVVLPSSTLLQPLSFRQETIARTQGTAVAEAHLGVTLDWFVLDQFICAVVEDKLLKETHEIMTMTDELVGLVDKGILVDQVLREQVAKFEKLIECRFVGKEFLDPVKESYLF